jgi:aspartate/methionine/tyrosine aminotransferase
LSKRSNLAGARVGFYAGDGDLVTYLSEVRKHAGFMVPGPVQAAAVAAWGDDVHVEAQRARYLERLQRLSAALEGGGWGLEAPLPAGGFYLWVAAPEGDAWALVRRLATEIGVLASPGEFYGTAGAGHVRFALVQPLERIDLIVRRLASARAATPSGRMAR